MLRPWGEVKLGVLLDSVMGRQHHRARGASTLGSVLDQSTADVDSLGRTIKDLLVVQTAQQLFILALVLFDDAN